MLGLQSWPCSLFLLPVLLSASVQSVSLPGERLQTISLSSRMTVSFYDSALEEHEHFKMLLSQLLPLDTESLLAEEDTKEGSSFGPPFLSPTLPFLPSGARTARLSLWRKTLDSRKWALAGEWAWKAMPRGCFGLKMDRIGTFSGLGC